MSAGANPSVALTTPALVVDLAVFDDNVAAADRMLRGTGTVLLPHFKTHRVSALARRQLGPRASGMTCATVPEAEALAAHGVTNILLANEIVTEDKAARAAAVAARARLTVAVDSIECMRALSRAAAAIGCEIAVLVDVDVGLGRCGVSSPEAAVDLAKAVVRTPHLRLEGIMGYEGRIRTVRDRSERLRPALDRLAATCRQLREAGLPCQRVSSGGTSSLAEAVADPCVTEVQAGTYALMEPELERAGSSFRCAAYVVATVISHTGARTVVDAGRKAMGCEYGRPMPLAEGGRTDGISDEHTVIYWSEPPPAVGATVTLRPSQIRSTFNLHNRVWLVDGDRWMSAAVDGGSR